LLFPINVVEPKELDGVEKLNFWAEVPVTSVGFGIGEGPNVNGDEEGFELSPAFDAAVEEAEDGFADALGFTPKLNLIVPNPEVAGVVVLTGGALWDVDEALNIDAGFTVLPSVVGAVGFEN
jgi:hypothetical protein